MESDGGQETIHPATAEEEAVKKNTDCVYFLASPLTCKKGSDCEYRHSEGARINPRDCWYWLNGNCLNPKCSFRHPPLDSMFTSPLPNSESVPPHSETAGSTRTAAARGPSNINKQNVPCYYFQWGQCLKGEWCPFMHGPQTSTCSVSQQQVVNVATVDPRQTIKKDTPQQTSDQQELVEVNLDKPKAATNMSTSVPSATEKFVTKYEKAPSRTYENKLLPPYSSNGEPPARPQNIVSVGSGYSQSQPWGLQVRHSDEQHENGKDNDEFLPEYSPGFDVLVEDDIKDPEYYHNEDNFRRLSAHGGQNVEPKEDYDYLQTDYEPIAKTERDSGKGLGKYDPYEQHHSQYGRESKTSGRILGKPSSHERRVLDREALSDEMDGSDLRHRLLKQRRTNGAKSTSSRDGRGEHYRKDGYHAEKRQYGHRSRDEKRLSPDKPLSNRLQGRIAFPGRTTDTTSSLLVEKERVRTPRGRSSPVRQTNHQSRGPERIRELPSEEFNKDTRTLWSKATRKDGIYSLDFAGPKSLAELKGTKSNEFKERSIRSTDSSTKLNEVKLGKAEELQESEKSVSFEGPMPLSVILKRKRETEYADNEYSTGPYDNNEDGGESATKDAVHATLSLQSVPALESGKHNHKIGSDEEEGMIPAENEDLDYNGQARNEVDTTENEDGADLDNVEEEEPENYDERDGEFDYEIAEYKADDAENEFPADEDDLDDEDDFARKVSDMLS